MAIISNNLFDYMLPGLALIFIMQFIYFWLFRYVMFEHLNFRRLFPATMKLLIPDFLRRRIDKVNDC